MAGDRAKGNIVATALAHTAELSAISGNSCVDDDSNSTKARVEGTPQGLWLNSSVGWSGARSWVSRHPTIRFMQDELQLSRMSELRRGCRSPLAILNWRGQESALCHTIKVCALMGSHARGSTEMPGRTTGLLTRSVYKSCTGHVPFGWAPAVGWGIPEAALNCLGLQCYCPTLSWRGFTNGLAVQHSSKWTCGVANVRFWDRAPNGRWSGALIP